jgi:hypothetical protein
MKIMLLVLAFASAPAFAAQTIDCYEFNKDGSRSKRGGSVTIVLDGEQGSVKMAGFWKKGSGYGYEFSNPHANWGTAVDGSEYGTIFFNDLFNGEMVEYQLQLKANVENRSFEKQKATLVIGLEETSSDAPPAWGYDVVCSGKSN